MAEPSAVQQVVATAGSGTAPGATTPGSTTGGELAPLRVDDTVRRLPLAEQIKDRLLQAILEGRIKPDSRLIELQISRQFGTSQAPVREALRGLEALGVVEISPFRGARVRRPSTAEILEAYAVRSELESLGARLAVKSITPADLDELAGYIDQMKAAAVGRDGHAVAVADASFHSRIIEIGGNTTLGRVWRTLEPFSRTLITLVMPGSDPMWTASLHEPILAALRAGDGELAAEALRQHFADAERLAAKVWTEAIGNATSVSSGPVPTKP
jgi:DNA-binding GntR family transcriptional regulator